jgi:hypothetical protein
MTQEWSKELEQSSEILQISSAHSTLPCVVHGRQITTLHNPFVGANIISTACALEFLGDEPLVPTNTVVMGHCGEPVDRIGILSQIPITCSGVQYVLVFHVFDIENFDLMIGFPIEKFLIEVPTQGRLDFRVGKEVLSIKITGSKHAVTDTSPDSEWIEEVKAIIPGEFLESFLDENARDFIEEGGTC